MPLHALLKKPKCHFFNKKRKIRTFLFFLLKPTEVKLHKHCIYLVVDIIFALFLDAINSKYFFWGGG